MMALAIVAAWIVFLTYLGLILFVFRRLEKRIDRFGNSLLPLLGVSLAALVAGGLALIGVLVLAAALMFFSRMM